jgi:uncharacterized protein (TIGR04255 family)
MSGALYPNQPLAEVAVEVRYAGELAVEARRHEFQALIRDTYPKLLLPGAQGGVAPSLQHYRFEREDELSGVQVAVNSFSYYSRRYPGAPEFIDEATRLYGFFSSLVPSIDVRRVGWRYINAIPFIREGTTIPLSRYFTARSVFADGLHDRYIRVNLEAEYDAGPSHVSVRLASMTNVAIPQQEALILDIDASDSGGASGVPNAFQKLHGVARNVFEEFISEEYRAFLRGEPDAGLDAN